MLGQFRIVYLTGPRQSGKTTLARRIAAETGMRYHSLDDTTIRAAAAADPHGFVRSLAGHGVVLDEFQSVPDLIPAIKEASDRLAALPVIEGAREHLVGRFLLTGSADIFGSARTQEALPGHMARLELLPLSLAELHGGRSNIVDLLLSGRFPSGDRYPCPTRAEVARMILRGGYPELQRMSNRARNIWFRSYARGRIFKDFTMLYPARGDYVSRLQALLPRLAGQSANLLRYAGIGSAVRLTDKLVKSYVETLELMFLLRRVPSYRKNLAAREALLMPKLHFLDTGLACSLLGIRTVDRLLASRHYGAMLETLVFAECAKHAQWSHEEPAIHHYRDKRGREVDIVLERPDGGVVGVEVKASATVGPRDFDGLAALAHAAGSAFERGVLIHTGEASVPFDRPGVRLHAVPFSAFTGQSGG